MNVEKKYIKDAQNEDGLEIDIFKSIENGVVGYRNKYVRKTGRKRFAYPTKEEALINFKTRTDRCIKILKGYLFKAQNYKKQSEKIIL